MALPWKTRGTLLFLAVWFVYSVCPPFTSYDSYWSVPTALSILSDGDTSVDEFVQSAPPVALAGLECVPAAGPPLHYGETRGCPGGHYYNLYPLGVSIFALPLIFFMKLAVGILGPLIPQSSPLFSKPIIASFFSGDLVGGHALAELWCASTFGALTVWLQYRMASLFVSARAAMGLALLFAFGTSEWSIASRNLFQHGLAVLLLSATIYLLLIARDKPQLIRYASIPLALSFVVRPWSIVSVVVLTVYVALHHRRQLIPFLLWASPVAVLFFGYNLVVRHSLLPLYVTRTLPARIPPLDGLMMHLFSPSRGVLIFTPFVIFSLAGMVLCWRLRWCFPLAPYLSAIVVLSTALYASFWPGHGYGPRYFADLSHLFVFFLIPAMLYWRKLHGPVRVAAAGAFLLVAAWSVFTHGRGATSIAANQWSALPVNVDQAMSRVWDWSDPQFLRGLR